jgi:hypothetical protein
MLKNNALAKELHQYPYSGRGELLGSAIKEHAGGIVELDFGFELEVGVAEFQTSDNFAVPTTIKRSSK